jgi:hypothetical protein
MPQTEAVSVDSSRLDEHVARLESNLRVNPSDKRSITALIQLLDSHLPSERGLGIYSDCQRLLSSQFRENTQLSYLLEPDELSKHYRQWVAFLESNGITIQVAQTQIFAGQVHSIGSETAYCPKYMELFKSEGVIPQICHECYKVQILPLDLTTLFQVYVILHGLELPRDNCRKCMVEVREEVPYPYKGYIYCQSEDEANNCLEAVERALRSSGISNVISGISHGCSEYGLRYPDWKYSKNGSHRLFERPEPWNASESEFFATTQDWPSPPPHFNKDGVTVCDIFVFNTWVNYAEIIGDDSWKTFHESPASDIPIHFARRVRNQSEQRKAEFQELKNRHGALARQ